MSSQRNQSTKYSTEERMRLLASVFTAGNEWILSESTGNVVYDTFSLYCDFLRLHPIGYSSVQEIYGEKFDCLDIARLSHITARQIKLNDKWYNQKSYPFIGYYGTDRHPVLCVPEGIKSYYAYDCVEQSRFKVTKEKETLFSEDGITICRNFPRRSLKFVDILTYAKHFIGKLDIFCMCITILLSTLVGLLLPILNEKLFDSLIPMGSFSAILQVGLVILTCSVGNIFFLLVKNFCSFRAFSLAKYAIMDATFERIYHLPQNFIESFGSNEIVNRALNMMQGISSFSSSAVTAGIGAVLSVLYLFRMFRKSWKLTIAALLMIAVSISLSIIVNKRKEKYYKEVEKESCILKSKLLSGISGIMKIRLSGMEERFIYDYQKHNSISLKWSLKGADLETATNAITIVMDSIYTIVLYYLIVKKNLSMSIGQFTAFTAAFGLFSSAIMQLVDIILLYPQIKPAFDRAMPIYETACESLQSGASVAKLNGEIEIDNVSFSYENDEQKVLDGLSISIKPGEYIGIVGHSGCGKSTLVKLLLGYEKPTSGKIYYDSKDLDTLDKTELRRQMGVVLQDGRLLSGTIYENVALSAPYISQEQAKKLLLEAGMGPDLEKMPMGVLTVVSEYGGNISGGQQQRILIARALANNPSVLIFDEATSALDNKAQSILCDTLEKRHNTRIAIAHRLTTVEKCDRIIVLDHGRIVEEGSYSELAKAGGVFERMIEEQELFNQQNF